MHHFTGLIQKVYAQAALSPATIGIPKVDTSDPASIDISTVESYINTVVNILFYVAGIACLVIVIYAAIGYALAYGDESKVETSKKTITWALIGLVIIGVSKLIVNFVQTQISS